MLAGNMIDHAEHVTRIKPDHKNKNDLKNGVNTLRRSRKLINTVHGLDTNCKLK